MPNHFTTIGLPVETEQDMLEVANGVVEDADVFEFEGGVILRWVSATGAALWILLDEDNNLIDVLPHFIGKSSFRVGLAGLLDRDEESPLTSTYQGWAEPADDDCESGTYPFVFDSPDVLGSSDITIPSIQTIQLAAFAYEIEVYESEEAYVDSQSAETKMATRSFIPSGMFSIGDDRIEQQESPTAMGLLTGHILETQILHNDLTGRIFYWALVDSYGGQFDVVIDPEILGQRELRVGGILAGSFWLSGCFADAR